LQPIAEAARFYGAVAAPLRLGPGRPERLFGSA